MGPPVRTVCVACLQSLEFSSEGESSNPSHCPYCGYRLNLNPSHGDAETSDGFAAPPPEAKTPRVDPTENETPGQVGRFFLREPLGEGGYGQVFRAFDPHLEREVALKVLKPNRFNDKALERFFREARAAARLDHPNIVGLHDAGRDEGRCWIAYQLVTGQTLSVVRDLGRPSIDGSVRIVRDLALALDHAHQRGVFHRDLKPANILIDKSGRPRLTDFGLARRIDLESDLTMEGTVLGTPHYMSPEAAAGRAHEADARSDVYSLGVILYELLCGKRPSDLPSVAPLWRSTRLANPPTPRSIDRAIPLQLDRVCMKALAFDPEARYPDAISLAGALTRYLNHDQPVRGLPNRSRFARLFIGCAIAGLLGGLVIGWRQLVDDRPATEPSTPVPAASSNEIPQPVPISKVENRPAVATLTSKANPAEIPSVAPEIKVEVLKPVFEDDSLLLAYWKTPVVWVQGSDDMKIHQAGCQHLKRTVESRLKPLGAARDAVALGYKPCKTCLKPLSLELEKRPAP